MDYGGLLLRAGRLVRQQKSLWVLGLLAVLPQASGHLLRLTMGELMPRPVTDVAAWQHQLDKLINELPSFSAATLLGGTAVFFVVLLAGWLLLALVEGAIIQLVVSTERGQPVTLAIALRQGRAVLGRFIAIDTAVFLPLFLVLLMMLLGVIGLSFGSFWVAFSEQNIDSLMVVWGIGAICLLPLLCLLLPTGFVTIIWRMLAFRETAVFDSGVKISVRRSWQMIKTQTGPLLIWAAILTGIPYLVGWLRYLVLIPEIGGLALGERPFLRSLLFLFNIGFTLFLLALQAGVRALILTAWTLVFIALRD